MKTSKSLSGHDCTGCREHSDRLYSHFTVLITEYNSVWESTREASVQNLLTGQPLSFWFPTLVCENSTAAVSRNTSVLGEAGFMVFL